MNTTFQFKSEAQVIAACRKWWGMSKTQRCQAICKQNNLEDASQIWVREHRGKCQQEYTFITEWDGEWLIFTYWGQVLIGDTALTADMDIEQIKQNLARPYEEDMSEDIQEDMSDRDWEYIPEDD